MLLPGSVSIGIPPVYHFFSLLFREAATDNPTVLKCLIRDLQQQSLGWVHTRRLFSGNGEKGGIKTRRVFLDKEATVMIDLGAMSAQLLRTITIAPNATGINLTAPLRSWLGWCQAEA